MVGSMVRTVGWIAGLAGAMTALGCGPDGPNRYRVTGTVTFDNKPIPGGLIVFSPDLAKNNDGPQGVAEIKAGAFDTQGGYGKGVVGGPMTVSVTGLAADGRPLCQFELTLDLPQKDSRHDIAVPKSAASTPDPAGGP